MYIGYTYNQKFNVEKGKYETVSFENVYEALNHANIMWNHENENDQKSNRFLVVKNISDTESNGNCAYFQFTDSDKCIEFINKQEKVKWSELDNKIWNENCKLM